MKGMAGKSYITWYRIMQNLITPELIDAWLDLLLKTIGIIIFPIYILFSLTTIHAQNKNPKFPKWITGIKYIFGHVFIIKITIFSLIIATPIATAILDYRNGTYYWIVASILFMVCLVVVRYFGVAHLNKVAELNNKYKKFTEKQDLIRKNSYHLGYFLHGDNWIFRLFTTDKHLLTIAPTRTGKGRGLVLPNLLNLPNHSVFVIDPKGENALVSARYRHEQGHKIMIFNPYGIFADEFKARGFEQFKNFNPLANLDSNSPDFVDDAAIIAEALIYDTGGDSHWTEAARGFIEFLIMYLVTEPTETPTLRRLRQIIAMKGDGIKEIRARCLASDFETVRDNILRYTDESKEVDSLLATAETQTSILKSNAICSAFEGDKLDFGRMKNEKISVYLILPSKYLITKARYLRLVLLVAMSQFMQSERGKHQVLVMLDEFANLGPLKVIENGYGLIAGHGVTLWSFVQNLTQLKNLYKENWPVFLANSAAVTVSNVNDTETAAYFNRRAARCEVKKSSAGFSGNFTPPFLKTMGQKRDWGFNIGLNTNKSATWEDNLPEAALYNANPDSLFLFLEGRDTPEILTKLRYDEDEPFRTRADNNPMHKQEQAEMERTRGYLEDLLQETETEA